MVLHKLFSTAAYKLRESLKKKVHNVQEAENNKYKKIYL